jgi:hypothetical protein
MDTILDLLDPQVLSAAYQQKQTTRPTLLTDTFFRNPENVAGDSYELFIDPFESRPLPMNKPRSEARVIQAAGADSRRATLFAMFNKLPFDTKIMEAIREPDSPTLQKRAKTEITRQLEHYKTRHSLTKEVILAKILSKGIVYLDPAGNVLESASGAEVVADFNVPASRKNQLNQGSGDLISASFATDGTDIQLVFDKIDIQAQKDGVPKPKNILCNSNFKVHLRTNTDFRTWASASASISEQTASGETIKGLFGKNWTFYDGTYQNASGVETLLIPDNQLIMYPDPTEPCFKSSNGSTLVPRQIGVASSVEELIGSLDEVFGEFAYAKMTDDPVQLFAYMGDKWGFNFADPRAIWMPTVVY